MPPQAVKLAKIHPSWTQPAF